MPTHSEAAAAWHSWGATLLPLKPGSKAPIGAGWQHTAYQTDAQLISVQAQQTGLGVLCGGKQFGQAAGPTLVCIDLDERANAEEFWERYGDSLSETRVELSCVKKLPHVFWWVLRPPVKKIRRAERTPDGKIKTLIEVLCAGHNSVVAPTSSATILHDHPPATVDDIDEILTWIDPDWREPEIPAQPSSLNEPGDWARAVLDRFPNAIDVFDHFNFGGERRRDGEEIRLMGHGGLLCKGPVWNSFSEGEGRGEFGGGPIEAAAYILHGDARKKSGKDFVEIVKSLCPHVVEPLPPRHDAPEILVESEKPSDKPPDGPPEDPMGLWDLNKLFAHEFPPDENIMGDYLLASGDLCILAGPPDVGKSRIANQLIFDILLRRSHWLETVPIHRPDMIVMLLQTENAVRRMKSDFAAQLKGVDRDDRNDANARFVFHVPITAQDRSLSLADPHNIDRLTRTVKYHRPDLIVIDPWGDIFGGESENDAVQTRQYVKKLMAIVHADSPETACLLIHHARTGKDASKGAAGWEKGAFARGSKALTSIARSQINIAPADAAGGLILVSCGKLNDGKKFDPFFIRLCEDSRTYRRDWEIDYTEWAKEMEENKPTRRGRPAAISPELALKVLETMGGELTKSDWAGYVATSAGVTKKTAVNFLSKMVIDGAVSQDKSNLCRLITKHDA